MLPRALILSAVLSAAAAHAACKKDGVFVFPAPGAVVPTNARMIIEGVGAEQTRVGNLVGQELVLRAADDAITVKVVAGWKSGVNRTAVQLRPSHPMKPNTQYSLMIDAFLANYEIINEGALDSMTWRTGDHADEKAPKFQLKPSIAEGMYQTEGDAVSKRLTVHTALTEESPAYLVVTIKRARGATSSQTYFVPLNGAEATIGQDACSGSFAFEDGRAYKASIEVYDVAGNAAPPQPAIEFQAPRPLK
jgi:hypothetical protein